MAPIPFADIDRIDEKRQDATRLARFEATADFGQPIRQAVRHCNPAQLLEWHGQTASLDNLLADYFVSDESDFRTFLALAMKAARTDPDMAAWWESFAKGHDQREWERRV